MDPLNVYVFLFTKLNSITTAATIAKTMVRNRLQPLPCFTTLVTTCGGGAALGAMGRPHCGHVGAWSETCCPQSSHVISATTTSPSQMLRVRGPHLLQQRTARIQQRRPAGEVRAGGTSLPYRSRVAARDCTQHADAVRYVFRRVDKPNS